jgi:hypothetical protein
MNKLSNGTSNKTKVFAIKILLVLLASFMASVVFGLIIPFALIACNILPNMGLVSVVYLIIGGSGGLLFGSISASISLFKSEKIITPFYIKMMICFLIISILYLISYYIFPEAYSHI